jgi:F-type H+-transporting ATPase subunit gamma
LQESVFDDLTFDNVAKIADLLTEKFVSGDYDKIELIYNQFKMLQHKSFKQTILPLAPIKSDLPASTGDYILNLQKKSC